MILAAALLLSRLALSSPPAPPSVSAAFFAAHREKFFGKLPAGAIAIFHSSPEARGVSSDPYRQNSDFWYLTGLEEPGAVAVLWQGGPGERRYLLFLRPKDFAAEQWTGWRAGLDGAKKDFGAEEAYPLTEFWDRLPKLSPASQSLYYEGGGDEEFGRKLLEAWNAGNANSVSPRPAADAAPVLAALRLVKDEVEQALLREASRLAAEAHAAAMREIAPGRHEYDLKAAMVGRCLAGGAARMAYPPIVASGRNSVILHHERDDKLLDVGEIVVNDTGCEYRMYAADVTRSYPVSGRFSEEQKQIYGIVLAAQKAGFAAVRPGAAFHEVHDATVRVTRSSIPMVRVTGSGWTCTMREATVIRRALRGWSATERRRRFSSQGWR